MNPVPKCFAALALAALAAGTLAACGSSTSGGGNPSPGSGKPAYGGTLNLVASGDVDHLDPLSSYYLPSFDLELGWTRQLVSYLPSNNPTLATTIAPDMATEVPTRTNGGISANGLTYTFRIKPGIDWDTHPARAVTSQDFLREFKAMCNPVVGVGNLLYYEPVIAGMTTYCNGYTAAFANNKSPTASQLAAFQNSHSISGIATPSSSEIQFTLTESANDFLNILAMPFASARPAEYDSYIPDSAQMKQHVISDGPYAISTYVPNKKIVMTRDPAWKQSTDTLRHDYLSSIVVTEGTNSPQTAMSEIQAGSSDLMWDLPVPTSQIQPLEAAHSPGLHIYANTGSEGPYLVFNTQSPDDNHAMSKLLVRQAIEYAINKVAIAKIYGGTGLNPILNGAVAQGNVGYSQYNYYPTMDNEGNAAECKTLLARAGYPHGLTLKDAYRTAGDHGLVFTSVQADLKACGITDQGVPEEQGPYYTFLMNGPNSAKPNQWDVTEAAWAPDWLGNDARANIVPLFQKDCQNPTSNFGCYDDPKVDSLIGKALVAPYEAAAAPYWIKAGQQVMRDAAIVPMTTQDVVLFAGSRLHNLIYNPVAEQYDITQLWVN
ncbi:MAG TPA: ABC transporter substrate-binding protein [Streptosporangiaceae bacterium]